MKFLKKYKEVIFYVIFGILTTLVNILTYFISTRMLSFTVNQSNLISWVVSIVFAFMTNKFFVFDNKSCKLELIIKEFFSFLLCRGVVFLIEILLMNLIINCFLIDDIITKVITSVVVIILNYLFSKLYIFKK